MSVSVSCCMHVFVVKFLFMVTSLQPLQPPLYIPLLLRVVSSWMWLLFYFIVFYTPTTFPHRAMRHNVRFIMICVCMRLKAYYVFTHASSNSPHRNFCFGCTTFSQARDVRKRRHTYSRSVRVLRINSSDSATVCRAHMLWRDHSWSEIFRDDPKLILFVLLLEARITSCFSGIVATLCEWFKCKVNKMKDLFSFSDD